MDYKEQEYVASRILERKLGIEDWKKMDNIF
jgi:hypothetical protein